MENIETKEQLLESYWAGKRNFSKIEFDDGQNLSDINLKGASFEHCFLSDTDFSRANLEGCSFFECNIKCSDFTEANLTNAAIRNCSVEATDFKNATVNGFIFQNNYAYGAVTNDIENT